MSIVEWIKVHLVVCSSVGLLGEFGEHLSEVFALLRGDLSGLRVSWATNERKKSCIKPRPRQSQVDCFKRKGIMTYRRVGRDL